jgi:fatty-acyl-CoA synthase
MALLLPNCPDYVAIWLGLTRIGCTVALVNTNLLGDALLHSVRVAAAKHVIVGASLHPALRDVAERLPTGTHVWVHGGQEAGCLWPCLETQLAVYDGTKLSAKDCALPTLKDRALLIYTSGTTGAPKAANVTHGRIMEWSFWFAGMMGTGPDDRMYDCLPLYHSVGGIVAIGALLVRGGSVMIRKRFSASRFWDDIVEYDCTIFQYIGELCRYLTASPPHPKERAHRLRLACGNGMQGDVWNAMQPRFAIPQILEFYAATEGSVSLYNCEGKPGAIGRVPSFLSHRFPVALIRCDAESGAPLRDATGFCQVCEVDEIGEAIGKISTTSGAAERPFDGYTDTAASERKILRDVFTAGDCWFRTGDLMRKDASGFYYFVDRIGDTFRWKGENVATTEVAAVLRAYPGVVDAVVYGVTIPHHEGRAGMAALATDEGFVLADLRAHLMAQLPIYAQPLFVRCSQSLDLTGTFKLTKGKLLQEGYENAIDPVWLNDREAGAFVICDRLVIEAVHAGKRRL